MRFASLFLLVLCTLVGWGGPVQSAEAEPKDPRVDLRLVEAGSGELALVFEIEDGWHIYWHNPGDSGMATTATLQPGGGEPRYPGPQRFVAKEGGFVTYGYSGRAALFFSRSVPSGAEPLVAEARWLICRERCLLQEGRAQLTEGEVPDLDRLRARLPQPVEPGISYRADTAVVLLAGGPFELFPPAPLEEKLKAVRSTAGGLELDLEPGFTSPLPVVLEAPGGAFVAFDLPPPPPRQE